MLTWPTLDQPGPPPVQRCGPTTWLLTRSTSFEATAEACILQAGQLQHHVFTL